MARRPRGLNGQGGEGNPSLPSAIRLTVPHGFIDPVHDKGVFHWEAGEVVTKPVTIALLIERGASWEPVECPAV
ncbi:hypothetical protein AD929_15715 [Gluconobacter potus]|uniref:Uncharacterized protein n=1 Tax=Gluconobacter potus TaxID=2724927 RepID=A0A149QPL0_9PROT|nr:hypothetical protein [Gluconobacter potus]KXU99242.1 hypothetical protein AD929_15715 [Gluconobacter potus]